MLRRKEIIDQVPIYVPGKPIEEVLKEYGVSEAIKLASNENPLGLPVKVKEALVQHIDLLYYYPDGKAAALRTTLATFLNVKENQLLFGAGLEDIIQMISAAFLESGTNAVMSGTTFPNYKINALIESAEVREIPANAGEHDLLSMSKVIDDNTRIVWVCNPNNPTGTYISQDRLVAFIEQVPQDVLIVLDEAYYEFATADDFPNSLSLMEKFPNLIILRTFSKAYGLAGLRIGYAITTPSIISMIERVRKPFNTSVLAQIAAKAALEDQQFMHNSISLNTAELEYSYRQLERLGIHYYRSQTNFIYMDVGIPSNIVYEELLKYGVIIRPMAGNCIRVSMGLHEHNVRFFEVFEKVVSKKR